MALLAGSNTLLPTFCIFAFTDSTAAGCNVVAILDLNSEAFETLLYLVQLDCLRSNLAVESQASRWNDESASLYDQPFL
jgi:hypothetical protein